MGFLMGLAALLTSLSHHAIREANSTFFYCEKRRHIIISVYIHRIPVLIVA